MQDYRIETEVSKDGSVIVKGVPFRAGDKVEVIIRSHAPAEEEGRRYLLRGKRLRYADPFGGVAENDWEALR